LDKDDFDIRSIYPDFPENELGWHMVDGKLKQFVTTDGMARLVELIAKSDEETRRILETLIKQDK
jgi:hypothetical protein